MQCEKRQFFLNSKILNSNMCFTIAKYYTGLMHICTCREKKTQKRWEIDSRVQWKALGKQCAGYRMAPLLGAS